MWCKFRSAAPLVVYLLVSLVATWPLLTHLSGWVPGVGDWGQNLWALWWTRRALLVLGQSPFFTRYLFYPDGVSLLFHPLDVSDGLLALPLYGLLGGDATYNVLVLLSFALGGWGAYLLALELTGRRSASLVAGLIFALSPYHFLRLELGHLNLSTLQWIPFYVLFLLRFVRSGARHSALLAVFFLVFNALNSWYYVVYCGLLSLALVFWPGARERVSEGASQRGSESARERVGESDKRAIDRPVKGWGGAWPWGDGLIGNMARVALVLGAALLLLAPLWWPMLQLLGSTTLVGEHNPLRHSVDLVSFWVPGPPSTWAGFLKGVWAPYAAQNREPGASAYLGYTVLGLAVAGVVGRRWRSQAAWWLAIALGFTLLALGPQLQLGGRVLAVPLPYQFLAALAPAFQITGIPGRFVVMTSLALAMLAAYGLAYLTGWVRSWGKWLALVAALLVSLEYLAVPLHLSPTGLPDFYTTLAAGRTSYAILDIKWDANYLMHAQTVHAKPLVGGWLARLPADQAAYLEQDRLDRAFLYLLLGPDSAGLSENPARLRPAVQAALRARQVCYIIDHGGRAGPWLDQLVGWPVTATEQEGIVYRSPDCAP